MDKEFIKSLLEESDEKKIKEIIAKRVEELCKQYEEENVTYFTPRVMVDGKYKFDYSAPKIKKITNVNFGTSISGAHGGKSTTAFMHPKYTKLPISSGLGDSMALSFDDVEEVYKMLIANLQQIAKNKALSQEEIIFRAVTKTVFDYVGGQYVEGGDKERFSHLKEGTDYNYEGNITSFKGSKHAMCAERSAISHQLFKFLGVDSAYCSSHIERRGGIEAHAFNLVKINGKTVLFDATLLDRSKKVCTSAVVFDNLDESVFDKAVESQSSFGEISFPDRELTDKNGQKYMLYYSKPKVDNVSV